MALTQWLLIALLAALAYGIRFAGLVAGDRIRSSPRLAPLLDDLPGLLIVALVAASLADASIPTWLAALAALAIAALANNVLITMLGGLGALLFLQWMS